MPSEEGRQVLELLAHGKIDPEQAYRLLRALGDIGAPTPPPPPPGPPSAGWAADVPAGRRGRVLRIRVSQGGRQKVNVTIPLAIARIGMKGGAGGFVRGRLQKFGIDLDELLKEVEGAGRIVDISDDEDHVEIFVE